jgi:hypothetical protein
MHGAAVVLHHQVVHPPAVGIGELTLLAWSISSLISRSASGLAMPQIALLLVEARMMRGGRPVQ